MPKCIFASAGQVLSFFPPLPPPKETTEAKLWDPDISVQSTGLLLVRSDNSATKHMDTNSQQPHFLGVMSGIFRY